MIAHMAGEAAQALRYTYDEYLAIERETGVRHEWYDGYVYAMAGGTLAHGALSAAIVSELRDLARKCGCVVFSSDTKVRIEAAKLSTYPDASVVCGPIETARVDANAMTNPTIVVEVLSNSTEKYDRGDKWESYRQLPSLKHFVLVSQSKPHIEVYTREGDHWTLRDAFAGESATLDALGGSIAVDSVYAGITLTETPPVTPERAALATR